MIIRTDKPTVMRQLWSERSLRVSLAILFIPVVMAGPCKINSERRLMTIAMILYNYILESVAKGTG